MTGNMQAVWLNRLLNAIMAVGGFAASALAVGQVPPKLTWLAGLLSALGAAAAKFAKTPSQAIAAAVPPSKAITPPTGALALALCVLATLAGCATTKATIVSTVKDCADVTTHNVALGIVDDVAAVLVCDGGNAAALPYCVLDQLYTIAKTNGWPAVDCVIAEIRSKSARNAETSNDQTEFLKARRATAVQAWRAAGGVAAP